MKPIVKNIFFSYPYDLLDQSFLWFSYIKYQLGKSKDTYEMIICHSLGVITVKPQAGGRAVGYLG